MGKLATYRVDEKVYPCIVHALLRIFVVFSTSNFSWFLSISKSYHILRNEFNATRVIASFANADDEILNIVGNEIHNIHKL